MRRVRTLPPPPPGRGLDRRELLKAGGLLAAALAGFRLPAPVAAATAPELAAARCATYRALVAALRQAPDGAFGARDPEASTRAFCDWYASQGPQARLHAEAVLDGVDDMLRDARGDRARYAALRDRPGAARPTAGEAALRATIVAALALAAPGAPSGGRVTLGALA